LLLFSKNNPFSYFFRELSERRLEFMPYFGIVQLVLTSDELLKLHRQHNHRSKEEASPKRKEAGIRFSSFKKKRIPED